MAIARRQMTLLEDSRTDRAVFRPIHYLGSKWRLLHAIESALADLVEPGSVVCDPFSGSGVVAGHLADRFVVVASDIQEYGRVLASALLDPPAFPSALRRGLMRSARAFESSITSAGLEPLIELERTAFESAEAGSPESLCEILEFGSIVGHQVADEVAPIGIARFLALAAQQLPNGPEAVQARYYGGIYFAYEQAAALDGLGLAIDGLPPEQRDLARAALISTASEIVSTVGSQFAQPVRPRAATGQPKARLVQGIARKRRLSATAIFEKWLDLYVALPRPRFQGVAMRGDYRAVLDNPPASVSAVYADPPYTRDHYSRFYHVLETMVLRDEPALSNVTIRGETRLSRGLYRAERHQSPFCIKTQAPSAFRDLFERVRALEVPLVLSYSPYAAETRARPRLLTIDQIGAIASDYFASVDVRSAGSLAHSKFNASHLNTEVVYDAEVLFVCRN